MEHLLRFVDVEKANGQIANEPVVAQVVEENLVVYAKAFTDKVVFDKDDNGSVEVSEYKPTIGDICNYYEWKYYINAVYNLAYSKYKEAGTAASEIQYQALHAVAQFGRYGVYNSGEWNDKDNVNTTTSFWTLASANYPALQNVRVVRMPNGETLDAPRFWAAFSTSFTGYECLGGWGRTLVDFAVDLKSDSTKKFPETANCNMSIWQANADAYIFYQLMYNTEYKVSGALQWMYDYWEKGLTEQKRCTQFIANNTYGADMYQTITHVGLTDKNELRSLMVSGGVSVAELKTAAEKMTDYLNKAMSGEEPEETNQYVALKITADDVEWNVTSTTIHWELTDKDGVKTTGDVTSDTFAVNDTYRSVDVVISYSVYGLTDAVIIKQSGKEVKYTGLTITADDVQAGSTTTTIHWTLSKNDGTEESGTDTSEDFGVNDTFNDRTVTITYTKEGYTKTYDITQSGKEVVSTGLEITASNVTADDTTTTISWTLYKNNGTTETGTDTSEAFGKNDTFNERTVTVSYTKDGFTKTYDITQYGKSVTPTELTAYAEPASASDETATIHWTLKQNNGSEVTGVDTVEITKNTTFDNRTVQVEYTRSGFTITVDVEQAGRKRIHTLSITADDVAYDATTTTIHYKCVCNDGTKEEGDATSEPFDVNDTYSPKKFNVSYSIHGQTQEYEITQAAKPVEYTVTITADDVEANDTYTTIHYECSGSDGSHHTGDVQSTVFGANDSFEDKEINLSFTHEGITKTVTITQRGRSVVWESLTITADDVNWDDETTTIHWSATNNKGETPSGDVTSENFGKNDTYAPKTVTVSLTKYGFTKTYDITQGAKTVTVTDMTITADDVTSEDETTTIRWTLHKSDGSEEKGTATSENFGKNDGFDSRTVTITYTKDGFTKTYDITQAGKAVVYTKLTITADDVAADATTTTIHWTLTNNKGEQTTGDVTSDSFDANEGYTSKQVQINYSAYNLTASYTITQAAKPDVALSMYITADNVSASATSTTIHYEIAYASGKVSRGDATSDTFDANDGFTDKTITITYSAEGLTETYDITQYGRDVEYTGLTITADNVAWDATTTTIHWVLSKNNGTEDKGDIVSGAFDKNDSFSQKDIEIKYQREGFEASYTIKQGAKPVEYSLTIASKGEIEWDATSAPITYTYTGTDGSSESGDAVADTTINDSYDATTKTVSYTYKGKTATCQVSQKGKPVTYTLAITADDVDADATTTTIHWTLTSSKGEETIGDVTSEAFDKNETYKDITKSVSYTAQGITKTASFTHRGKIEEFTLSITADNADWDATTTTVHYTYEGTGGTKETGNATSDTFDANSDYTAKDVVVSYTYKGKTATYTIKQGAKPDNPVSLSITADNVSASATTTTIHYTLTYESGKESKGDVTSDTFDANDGFTDKTITVSYTLSGFTKTYDITQYARDVEYTGLSITAENVAWDATTTTIHWVLTKNNGEEDKGDATSGAFDKNDSFSQKDVVIKYSKEGFEASYTIKQGAKPVEYTLTIASKGNVAWDATSAPIHYVYSGSDGSSESGDAIADTTLEVNDTYNTATTIVSYTYKGKTATCQVTQNAKPVTYTFKITADNVAWDATSTTIHWTLKGSDGSEESGDVTSDTFDANSKYAPQTLTISYTKDGRSDSTTITQAAKPVEYTLKISGSDIAWDATSATINYTYSGSDGSSDTGTDTVSVSANTEFKAVTKTLSYTYKGNTATCNVTQAARPIVYTLTGTADAVSATATYAVVNYKLSGNDGSEVTGVVNSSTFAENTTFAPVERTVSYTVNGITETLKVTQNAREVKYTGLSITADDVTADDTTTTIYWTLTKNNGTEDTGTDTSKAFAKNTTFDEKNVEIKYSKEGFDATYTIKQAGIPLQWVSLEISSSNVAATDTYAVIHYKATRNDGYEEEDDVNSQTFGENTNFEDVQRTVSCTIHGITKSTTITQYAKTIVWETLEISAADVAWDATTTTITWKATNNKGEEDSGTATSDAFDANDKFEPKTVTVSFTKYGLTKTCNITQAAKEKVYTLTITADNVAWDATSTTIHWKYTCNDGTEESNDDTYTLAKNMKFESVEKEVSYSYKGLTATYKITQGARPVIYTLAITADDVAWNATTTTIHWTYTGDDGSSDGGDVTSDSFASNTLFKEDERTVSFSHGGQIKTATIKIGARPVEYTGLKITADNVTADDTTTTIYWTLTKNNGTEDTGTATSKAFDKNTTYTEKDVKITYSKEGFDASYTIKQAGIPLKWTKLEISASGVKYNIKTTTINWTLTRNDGYTETGTATSEDFGTNDTFETRDIELSYTKEGLTAKTTIQQSGIPIVYTDMAITADNIEWNETSTTIHWTLYKNNGDTETGTATYSPVAENTTYSAVERTANYTKEGFTRSCKFTQGAKPITYSVTATAPDAVWNQTYTTVSYTLRGSDGSVTTGSQQSQTFPINNGKDPVTRTLSLTVKGATCTYTVKQAGKPEEFTLTIEPRTNPSWNQTKILVNWKKVGNYGTTTNGIAYSKTFDINDSYENKTITVYYTKDGLTASAEVTHYGKTTLEFLTSPNAAWDDTYVNVKYKYKSPETEEVDYMMSSSFTNNTTDAVRDVEISITVHDVTATTTIKQYVEPKLEFVRAEDVDWDDTQTSVTFNYRTYEGETTSGAVNSEYFEQNLSTEGRWVDVEFQYDGIYASGQCWQNGLEEDKSSLEITANDVDWDDVSATINYKYYNILGELESEGTAESTVFNVNNQANDNMREISYSMNGLSAITTIRQFGKYSHVLAFGYDNIYSDMSCKIFNSSFNISQLKKITSTGFNYPVLPAISVWCKRGLNTISAYAENTPVDYSSLFYNISRLTNVQFNDFAFGDISSIDMNRSFYNCTNLTNVDFNISGLSNVTTMSYCFYNCQSLSSLSLPDMNGVQNMEGCFEKCYTLSCLSLPSINDVTTLKECFSDCSALGYVLVSSMYNLKTMENCFCNCTSLGMFTMSYTPNLTNISGCFAYCSRLTTLYLGNLSMVKDVNGMLYCCTALQSLYISVLPNMNLYNMFLSHCTALTVSALVNVLNALPNTSGGYTCTLGTTNLNKLTTAQKAIATGKGWTLN